ncbi:MAG: hypothetical protein E6Z13_09560, partial [Dermabacter sp.]|nr:hypothetical protein [Dermabacter sp.]
SLALLPGHLNALAEQISRRLGSDARRATVGEPPLSGADAPTDAAAVNAAAAKTEVCVRSPLIRAAHESGELALAHAMYTLDTGRVDFGD